MKKLLVFSLLVMGAMLLQAQSITVHQTCGQNGQVVKAFPPEAAEAVDLGLSIKWANMNVGATAPEDYGDYFAWGETATKATYDWSTYFDTNDNGNTFTKYTNKSGKTVLEQEDDAAHVNWGGGWRIPTMEEWQDLIDNSTWTWTTQNGVSGYKVTSNITGYTDKYIFLPAAGYRDGNNLYGLGSRGYYWMPSLNNSNLQYARYLYIHSGEDGLDNGINRCYGISVRAISTSNGAGTGMGAAEAVDLGLAVKWANMNVGATAPEDYGDYFAWGETAPKATYDWSTYFDTNDNGNTFTKYTNKSGKTVLEQEDDAAHVNWGGGWRIPTKEEWQELIDSCTWTWTTQNGINGSKVTSNKEGYTDQFIFIPAAGYRSEDGLFWYNTKEGDLYNAGSIAYYWASSLYLPVSYAAWNMGFRSDRYDCYGYDRDMGQPVRPVLLPSYSTLVNDTIRIYSNGCDDYQTFIGSHESQLTITANSDQWSYFVRWQDGNTDNPRTITTNGNADYTAYFETYLFFVDVLSDDEAGGSVYISKVVKDGTIKYNESVGNFEAGSEVEIYARANYGYHFVRWSDGNTSQQRSFILTKDTTFTAIFDKNVYFVTKNAEHGSISGNSSAEYLDEVTLSVSADSGYHFEQWNDGNTDNPRTIVLTQDTILTAIIVMDTTGSCGKDYALTWAYNPSTKTLAISGDGSFDENMECGLVAKQEMTKLVINEGVTAIGKEAFSNCANLTTMQLPTTLKIIGERAFYYCLDLVAIYNYRVNPCLIETNTFEKVNTFDCVLYVLTNSIAKYKSEASGWKIFYYINPVDATTVDNQVTDVTVVPSDNNAVVTWPISENAATYTIRITKDDEVFCTLIFNGNGQLTDRAFALGRNGNRHALAATMTANGLQFTVTDLNSATHYALTLQAKDNQDAVLAFYSSEFTTTGGTPTGIDNTPFPSGEERGEASKLFRNGHLFILRGDKIYTVTGQEVK